MHHRIQVHAASNTRSALQASNQPVQVSPGTLHPAHVADDNYAVRDRCSVLEKECLLDLISNLTPIYHKQLDSCFM